MRILTIGTDRKLFEENSMVFLRMQEYAKRVDEMHIVVFTKMGYKDKNVGNLFIHPTNSLSRFHYISNAIKLGDKLIKKYNLSITNSVISTQDPFETGIVGFYLHKKYFLPLQVQVHTDFLSKNFKNSLLNRLRVLIAKYILPKAQGVRVVSEVIKDSIIKFIPKIKASIDVLPVFVDAEKINSSEIKVNLEKEFPQYKFIIFMASRLSKEKRIDVAIKSLKNIVGEFPQTGLVIAGNGSEKNRLERLSRKMGLEKNISFIGWQDDLISYFKSADLFLLTSEYEGYGMTLVESALCGCPIVTTKVGLAKTDIFKNGQNSIVCEVNDVKSISEAIMSLIHNNEKRELFKREMRSKMQSVTMKKEDYADRYISLIRKLINE